MAEDTFGGRLMSEMGAMTDKQLADILKKDYGITKSDELIKHWRNNRRKPNIDVLIALRNYFNVPADYLLGFDVPKTFDPDINMICKYTGLSQNAVEALHYSTLPEIDGFESDAEIQNNRTARFINRVLDRVSISEDKETGRQSVETIFSIMEDYVCSTGAWIEDKRTGEPMSAVTVNYGDAAPSIVTVGEFLSVQLFERIRKALDSFRSEYDTTQNESAKQARKHKRSSNKTK